MDDPKTATTLAPSEAALFAPLQHLGQARKGGGAYYNAIRTSPDELIRLGAYCQMLTLKVLPANQIETVLCMANLGAIKVRAFEFFQDLSDSTSSQRIAEAPIPNPDIARTALMKAELAFDHAGARDAHAAIFRDTGDIRELRAAGMSAENLGGWRAALEWHIRAMVITPVDPGPASDVYRLLGQANEFGLIEELNRILSRAGLHPYIVGVYAAAALLSKGDAKGSLTKLTSLVAPSPGGPAALRSVQAHSLRLGGEALEKLGDYQGSYRKYVEMNRLELAPNIDGKTLIQAAKADSLAAYPALPPAHRDDTFMLLGFPRSGTTLLEVALDAHPDIEAFEETPPWDAAMAHIRLGRRSGRDATAVHTHARDLYFAQIDRRRGKAGAKVVIDKYPLRTIYAVPLMRLLPEQKYLFSIRHPFDVVLSCFRQRFRPNAGMENFRTIEDAAVLYDFAMTQWFAVHDLDDRNVHYIKYDRLVTDFDATIGGVLSFLGLKWDDSVRNFVGGAHDRVALTPSYQKIRKGLSIGVQTSWRNYGFLFQSPATKPLHKWAEHFGYDTK